MAFVDYKYALLRFVCFHNRLIPVVAKCAGKFLNGSNNHSFAAIFQTLDKFGGRIGIVNAVSLERVVFVNSLVVQVFAVNQEENLIDSAVITKKRCALERSQRFTGTRCMPNVTVTVFFQNTAQTRFRCVHLIRTHYNNVL